MKNNKIKKSFRIDRELNLFIDDFLSNSSYNFSEIVNYALYDFLTNNSKNLSDNFENLNDNISNKNEKDLHIYISKKEYEYLKELSKKHGFNSVSKEAKFLLLNLLNSNSPMFNNIEMSELRNACYELNMVGRNINQILKVLYEQDFNNFKLNYENLITAINVANEKISKVVEPIEKYIEILNLKLKS